MGTLLQDLRYGCRMLLKTPGFTLVAIVALALGIGANTAIFSVVNGVLLRPLPFKDPDRLVWAQAADLKTGEPGGSISPPDFLDYREQNRVFEHFAALQYISFTLTGDAAEPERVTGARVSADFFETLGITPVKGRSFLAEEEREGSNRVAVISHGLWQRRFGSDPNLVGKTVDLSGQSTLVVGIMPAGFQFPSEVEVWSPIPFGGKETSMRRTHFLNAIGRLKPGLTLQDAQADITSVARRLEQQYPETNTNYGMGLTLLPEQIVGDMRRTLFVLLAAVGFVLLIACANVANLSLARGATRGKEIAIRVAMGASRSRVVRQLLTESVLLAVLGGVLGLLLAVWGVDMLVALSPEDLPRVKEVTIDPRVLSFSLLISILTGVLFGLAPALSFSRGRDLNETLKEGGRASGAATGHNRMRSLLVVAEVALSLMLLVGAGLLIKSFLKLSKVETGFDATSVMTMRISLPQTKYAEPQRRAAFYQQLLERTRALPGVEAAGVISELPLSGQNNDTYFTIEGKPPAAPGSEDRLANFRTASPDYFRVMGIPLIRGRFFNDGDREGAPHAVIISETFARRFFPDEDALGKRLTIDLGEPWTGEIVGVVGNIRHFSLATEPFREMYMNIAQTPRGSVNLVVRTRSDPAALTAAIKQEVQGLDRDLPIYNPKTMEQRVSESAAAPRFRTLLLALFAALALVLAAVGIYGVISYSVTQRTHEIGVRMALGAGRRDILKLVVGHGIVLTLIGVAIGLIGAFMLTRIMATFLFGVSATDPLTYAVVSLLLIGVALVACYVPARRAMRVDPMVALRYE
ncbi:MAG TPA: ABC transporter permease [Pyrinomonadaceae bacterium]